MKKNRNPASETENFFEYIFENVIDGINIVDAETKKFVKVNRALRRMLGYTEEEFLNIGVYDIHPKEALPHTMELFYQLLNEEIEVAKDVPVLTKGGALFYADITGSPIQYKGKPHLLAIFRNITERKKKEEKIQKELAVKTLRENEAILKSLFDAAPVGIAFLIDRVFVKVNNSLCKILGYSEQELLGQNTRFMFVDEDDYKRVGIELYGQMEREGLGMLEIRLKCKDGKIIDVLLHMSPFNSDNISTGLTVTVFDITERKQGEEALKKSEALLSSIFEASSAGIALLTDRVLQKINRSLCRITGYSEEELLGQTTRQLYFNEEEFSAIGQTYKEMERDGLGMTESRLRRKNGSEMNVLICLSPVNPDDLKAGVIATVLDITERKQAEEALKKSEALLKSLFEASPAGILILINRVPIKINHSFSRITGYSEEELLGKPTRQLYFNDEEYNRVGQAYKEMNSEGLSLIEARFRRKDGSVMNTLICLSYINSNDKEAGHIAVCLDITGLKQAELALKESEEKYRTLIDNMQDAVYRGDLNGNLVFVTPSAARLLGYSAPEEMMRMNIGSDFYYYPEKREEFLKVLKEHGKVTRYEVTLKRRDGKPIIVSTNSQLYCDRDDNIIGVEGVFSDITELKQAEEALRESEERFRSIINSIPIGMNIYHLEPSGNLVFSGANPAADKITGINNSLFIGKTIEEAFPALTELGVPRYYRDAAESGKSWHGEQVAYDENSIRGTYDVYAFQVGQNRMVAAFTDITKRKQEEEALKQSEELHRLLMENANDVISRHAPDGTVLYISQACRRVFGYIPEEIIGHKLDLIMHPDDWPGVTEALLKNIESRASAFSIQSRVLTKDGDVKWLESSNHLIYNDDGSPKEFHVVARDITERKSAEDALKKSEGVLKSLFNATPIGIGLLIGRVHVKINNSLCRILGYSEQEILGKNTRFIYPDESEYERVGKELYGQVGREGIGIMESRLKRKDGAIINVLLCLSSFEGRDVSSAGVVITVIDITEQKRMEAEKSHLEEMLLRSQKMEAIGTMAGGIAHDFNNILSGIFGYSELSLSVQGNPAETDRYLREILKASERARDLVSRILTFSRQTEPVLKPVLPKYIIKEAVKLLRASTPTAVELKTLLRSDSVIMAEPTLLHQVILNLCNNAIHAMQSRPGVIEISLEDMEVDLEFARMHPGIKPGKHIMLRVSDTGSGIAPEILDRIFEPFFTTKMQGEGTGLGLSVVHGIVKKLNGNITVYSEIGKGTVFNIIIPVVDEEKIEIEHSDSMIKGGTESILLIDDEKAIIDVLSHILEHLGYKVKAFTDCMRALDEFRNNPDKYNIVITDYSMPRMTGIEIALNIRKVRKDIPIILSSGYLNKEMEENSINAGVSQLLTKPVNSYQLADAIRKAISGNKIL